MLPIFFLLLQVHLENVERLVINRDNICYFIYIFFFARNSNILIRLSL